MNINDIEYHKWTSSGVETNLSAEAVISDTDGKELWITAFYIVPPFGKPEEFFIVSTGSVFYDMSEMAEGNGAPVKELKRWKTLKSALKSPYGEVFDLLDRLIKAAVYEPKKGGQYLRTSGDPGNRGGKTEPETGSLKSLLQGRALPQRTPIR